MSLPLAALRGEREIELKVAALRGAGSLASSWKVPCCEAQGWHRSDCIFPQCQGSSDRDSRRQAHLRNSFASQLIMGGLCYGGLPDQSFPIPSVPSSVCPGYKGCLSVSTTAASCFGGPVDLCAALFQAMQ